MNTTTVLLVVVALAAVLFLRNGSAAGAAAPGWYGTPQPPGPPINGMPATPPNRTNASGGSGKLNTVLNVNQAVDQTVVTGVCVYESFGAAAPVCSKAAGAIAKFNRYQTDLTIKGAKAIGGVVQHGVQGVANAGVSVARTIGGWL